MHSPASRFSGLAALVLAILFTLGPTTHPAYAQTTILTPADSHVGTPGAPGTGGNGSSGYFFYNPNATLIVNGPALTGGAGGEIAGTDAATNYAGGSGGAGLNLDGGTSYINSGTFTGGAGGAADGIGKNLIGGAGGDGLYANSSTANVYGGTVRGGTAARRRRPVLPKVMPLVMD